MSKQIGFPSLALQSVMTLNREKMFDNKFMCKIIMKSEHIFQIIKSWSSENKDESEITQELVIEPDPYRMGMRDSH